MIGPVWPDPVGSCPEWQLSALFGLALFGLALFGLALIGLTLCGLTLGGPALSDNDRPCWVLP